MKLEDWKASRLVYSTDAAATAPQAKASKPASSAGPRQQKVLVKVDRKGRRGKSVTLVEGVSGGLDALEALAKRLKTACGSGGTVKDGTIEIQGEHREKVMALLTELGYKPKSSGG